MAAAVLTGSATTNAQQTAAHPKARKRVFMLMLLPFKSGFSRLSSAVVLKIFEDRPRLFGRKVRPHAHVEQDGLPLGRGPLGGITLGVAPVAMHRIELCAAELVRGSFRLRF